MRAEAPDAGVDEATAAEALNAGKQRTISEGKRMGLRGRELTSLR